MISSHAVALSASDEPFARVPPTMLSPASVESDETSMHSLTVLFLLNLFWTAHEDTSETTVTSIVFGMNALNFIPTSKRRIGFSGGAIEKVLK